MRLVVTPCFVVALPANRANDDLTQALVDVGDGVLVAETDPYIEAAPGHRAGKKQVSWGQVLTFMRTYSTSGNMAQSCKVANFSRQWAFGARNNPDLDFAQRLEEATENYKDFLDSLATDRAAKGVEETSFDELGKRVGSRHKHDRGYLELVMKRQGMLPNQVQLTGANGGPIQTQGLHMHSAAPASPGASAAPTGGDGASAAFDG